MTATLTEARDVSLGLLRTAWLADSTSQDIPLLWWDTAQDPPSNGAWARVTMRHGEAFQATLAGETGSRRFTRTGVITVQIFTPTGDGLELSDSLAIIAARAYEGVTTDNGVWFRNVRANEVGQDGKYFQTNVFADFEYDEVR